MTNIVNLPPLAVLDPLFDSEIIIWVYYGARKLVLEINGGGIIYIKHQHAHKTETQSCRYGVARALFLVQIFGVLGR